MKNLTMVVHANLLQDFTDILRSIDVVQGFTISHVEGHGTHVGQNPFLSTHDKVVGHTPRLCVDVILEDNDVKTVLQEIAGSSLGAGQGIYWVTDVHESGRI